ncbi:hypothetical protein ES702_07874 [subsurface metagenome]
MKSSLPDPTRPMPDAWYVRMMSKRLKWAKCENRESVIALFCQYWPNSRIGPRAEEFYDRAITFLEEGGR